MENQSKLTVKYTNEEGEILTLVLVNNKIYFNHTGVTDKNEWVENKYINNYFEDDSKELKAFHGFRLYIHMI